MEGLRGFAVSLVFIQHFTTQLLLLFHPAGMSRSIAEALSSYGNEGVELFFVLSGYLIYGALIRRPSIWKFMRRRVQRIYPAFLVAFAIGLAIALIVSHKVPAAAFDAALYLVANLLLLPGLFPIEPVFAVAWSLSYEMFFYWAIALAVVLFGLNSRSRTTRILVIALGAALLTGLSVARLPYVPVRMLPFFAGMLLVEIDEIGTSPLLALGALAAPAVAFFAAPLLRNNLISGAAAAEEWVHTIAFFILCFACFRLRNIAAQVFSWAPLRWLGNMSYSYYLLHGFVVKAAMEGMARMAGHHLPDAALWMLSLPIFAMTLVPAGLLFLWVEKPYSLDR